MYATLYWMYSATVDEFCLKDLHKHLEVTVQFNVDRSVDLYIGALTGIIGRA